MSYRIITNKLIYFTFTIRVCTKLYCDEIMFSIFADISLQKAWWLECLFDLIYGQWIVLNGTLGLDTLIEKMLDFATVSK